MLLELRIFGLFYSIYFFVTIFKKCVINNSTPHIPIHFIDDVVFDSPPIRTKLAWFEYSPLSKINLLFKSFPPPITLQHLSLLFYHKTIYVFYIIWKLLMPSFQLLNSILLWGRFLIRKLYYCKTQSCWFENQHFTWMICFLTTSHSPYCFQFNASLCISYYTELFDIIIWLLEYNIIFKLFSFFCPPLFNHDQWLYIEVDFSYFNLYFFFFFFIF